MPETFYTLEEAAAKLNVSPQQLRQMAQRGEVRAFMDRGTWRFRASEVDDLARRLGLSSSSELETAGPKTPKPAAPAAGDGPRTPKPAQSPRPPAPKATESRPTMLAGPDVFPFDIASEPTSGVSVDLASLFAQGPKAPGSDSDVRLVPEGSDINLQVLPLDESKPPSKPSSDRQKPESQVRLEPAAPAAESQPPRLSRLEVESDSDVRLVDVEAPPEVVQQAPGRRDSLVRLEPDRRSDAKPDSSVQADQHSPEGSESTLQLELDLDAELQKAEQAKRTVSDSSEEQAAVEALQEDRTEFEGQGSEFELRLPDEETELASEDASGSATFRLKEEEDVTKSPAADSSSNQSLALDSGETETAQTEELSFELSLDEESTEVTPRPESAKRTPDSSSEFELTIREEEGDSEADTELLGGPAKKGSAAAKSVQESDTELEETSDYDLQLVEEEETAGEGESGRPTEVVIDEEAGVDEQTVLVEGAGELEEVSDLLVDADSAFEEPGSSQLVVEEEVGEVALAEEAAPAVRYVEVAPADWGLWALLHVPTTLVLIFAGFLLFELLRSTLYYHEPGMMGGQIYELLAGLFRK